MPIHFSVDSLRVSLPSALFPRQVLAKARRRTSRWLAQREPIGHKPKRVLVERLRLCRKKDAINYWCLVQDCGVSHE